MKFQVTHQTHYRYQGQVFLEPHRFYFYPIIKPGIQLFDFSLSVHPIPAGLTARTDAENNIFHQCWFNETIDELAITSQFKIENSAFNPFDFLVEKDPKLEHLLALELYKNPTLQLDESIISWNREIQSNTGDNVITWLSVLCREINLNFDHTIRYQETILEPNFCFAEKAGSCRDLSWLMIQIIRNQGIPARFVSGYAYNSELETGHELHAWMEAWISGAGWIGLDPSSGLFVSENYIPIAASYHPANTLPVQGTFRGTVESQLETKVKIEQI